MNKKPSDKGRLVKKYLENKPALEYKDALGKKDRGQGIYVLYNGKKIYYVGLSKASLRYRLRKHATRDRHKGKWTHFSFYQIGRTKYIKDIESLLLRVCNPPGNSIGGRFKRKNDLEKRLKKT